jgi:hypothetical protein
MILDELLLYLEKIVNLLKNIDLDEVYVDLKLPGVLTFHIPFRTVKEMRKDHGTVSNILSECFIRRKVMWEDFWREKAEYCKQSIDEMKDVLEDKAREFRKTGEAKDAQYADMLEAWANECVEASKSFREAIDQERRDREDYQSGAIIESGDIWRADSRIREILDPFRQRTYPFVNAFIQLLPKDSEVKKQAQKQINSGNSLLIADGMSPDQIATADWELQIDSVSGIQPG